MKKPKLRKKLNKSSFVIDDNFDPEKLGVLKRNSTSLEKVKFALKATTVLGKRPFVSISDIVSILTTIRLPMSRQLVKYILEKNDGNFITKLGGGGVILAKLADEKTIHSRLISGQTPYTSVKEFASLIEQIGNPVRIADPYADTSLLDILAVIDKKIYLKILTVNTGGKEKKTAFVRLGKRLLQERGSFEIRETEEDFHDRYVLGKKQVVLVGSSIKDIGKKDSTIVVSQDLFPNIHAWFEKKWSRATKII